MNNTTLIDFNKPRGLEIKIVGYIRTLIGHTAMISHRAHARMMSGDVHVHCRCLGSDVHTEKSVTMLRYQVGHIISAYQQTAQLVISHLESNLSQS